MFMLEALQGFAEKIQSCYTTYTHISIAPSNETIIV